VLFRAVARSGWSRGTAQTPRCAGGVPGLSRSVIPALWDKAGFGSLQAVT